MNGTSEQGMPDLIREDGLSEPIVEPSTSTAVEPTSIVLTEGDFRVVTQAVEITNVSEHPFGSSACSVQHGGRVLSRFDVYVDYPASREAFKIAFSSGCM